MDVIARVRQVAQRSLFLHAVNLITRLENPRNRIVQRNVTKICIEGYQRSANTFAVRMFRIANPGVHIGHHTHSTANIARALRYEIPAVVLIRNPVDAVTSSIIALESRTIDEEIEKYLAFYRWVESRQESVVLADFETVISEFNLIIKRINVRYGSLFNYIENLDDAKRQVEAQMYERTRKRHIDQRRWIGIPNHAREMDKKEVRLLVSTHPRIDTAQALHDRLVRGVSGV